MTTDQHAALSKVISVDADVMHGTPCFAGTRVPIQTLIDFIESGETVKDFLAAFPYVTSEQVRTFLRLSKDLAIEQLSCVSS